MIPKPLLFSGMPYLIGLVLTIIQLTINSASALEVNAEIDKNPVIVDESFTLTVTANDDVPRNAFRSDALLNTFIVGATSVDRSTSIINGQMERQTRWRVNLIARRAGQFEIPSFNIDGVRTSPIVVDVIEPSTSPSERGPVFMTTEIDNHTPYVQQQVRYTVRLHLAQTLENGSISPPDVANADIQQASNDDDQQEIIDGQRYRVITRTYFITPRRSGELVIQGSRFDGQVRDTSSRSFATFSRPQHVATLAPDVTLSVQPQPSDYPGHWLPSEQVVLTEEWDTDRRLIVGEPINRHITLTAQGVRDEQLPDIQVEYPAGLRFYPERTDRDSFSRQGQRVAQAQFRGVIIPAHAGTFELPSIDIQWWDVNAEQVRTASIPARTIEVFAPAGGIESPLAQEHQPDLTTPVGVDNPSVAPSHSFGWVIGVALLAVLWLATLVIALVLWRRLKNTSLTSNHHGDQLVPATSRESLRLLKQACQRNDATAAYTALNAWLTTTELNASSPSQLSEVSQNEMLTNAINSLEASLFSQTKPTWTEGDALWQGIQQLHRRESAIDAARLPDIYKSHL